MVTCQVQRSPASVKKLDRLLINIPREELELPSDKFMAETTWYEGAVVVVVVIVGEDSLTSSAAGGTGDIRGETFCGRVCLYG